MKMTQKLALGSAILMILSACATKPEPVQQTEPVQEVEAPAPVVPEPDPVTPAPVEDVEVEAIDPNLPTAGSIDDFEYQVGGEARVFFALNQHTLSSAARANLQQQANWLKEYKNYSAVIEGHADERGTREYNLALAARRADSAKAFLVTQGVAPSRIRTISYGKERPIDARSNEEGWARNRNAFTKLRSVGRS